MGFRACTGAHKPPTTIPIVVAAHRAREREIAFCSSKGLFFLPRPHHSRELRSCWSLISSLLFLNSPFNNAFMIDVLVHELLQVQIALSHAPTATLKAVPFAEEQGGISLNLEMPFELSLKYHVNWSNQKQFSFELCTFDSFSISLGECVDYTQLTSITSLLSLSISRHYITTLLLH